MSTFSSLEAEACPEMEPDVELDDDDVDDCEAPPWIEALDDD